MKKSLLNIFLFLSLFILICIPAYAQDSYFEITRSVDGVFYLSMNSIEERGNDIIAWIKFIPEGKSLSQLNKKYDNNVGYMLMLIAFNKNFKQTRDIKSALYDKLGDVISIEEYIPSQSLEIIPGSVSEAEYFCVMEVYQAQQQTQQ